MLLKDEFVLRELKDSWIFLYYSVARKMSDFFGRKSMEYLRAAVRSYGEKMAGLEVLAAESNKRKRSLYNYFWENTTSCPDPRYKIQVQFIKEDEATYDVLSCPLAKFFVAKAEEDLLLPYCEEFSASYVKHYCGPESQSHVSELLYREGEYSCRFAHYFRLANLAGNPEIFFSGGENKSNTENCPVSSGRKQLLAIPGLFEPGFEPGEDIYFLSAREFYLFTLSVYLVLEEEEDRLLLLSESLKMAAGMLSEYLKRQSEKYSKDWDFNFLEEHSCLTALEEIMKFRDVPEALSEQIELNFISKVKNSF